MSDKSYRIAVVGAGARGETFARQLYTGKLGAVLSGVCDTDAERLATFCEYCELDGAPRFHSVADLLREPELDGIMITTPEFTHADIAIAAMEAGKHVYLEKAMAQSSAECRRIMAAHRASNVAAFLGFNARVMAPAMKMKEIVDSGVLGQIIQISALEQLAAAHGAAFMRRFHRHSERSGGMLNTKCAHDLDLMQWLIGHEHKINRVASFGGTSIFTPDKQPAKYCSVCPIQPECIYRDTAGFVFPVHGKDPLHHPQSAIYGGDLCVYDPDKDLVDNQTVIMEWDNGVRGNFTLQMFQPVGFREIRIWGENAFAQLTSAQTSTIRVVHTKTGDATEYSFAPRSGGHGGSDPKMISLFLDAIKNGGAGSSGLAAGLAATLIAETADKSRKQEKTIFIDPSEYGI